ncbi:MAG: hypothetical protein D3910_04995 [Candidatus Electrothrix sp. ATG2]|nr:hypothetical protein [Candidatus Electrothrix sp. ATG2]
MKVPGDSLESLKQLSFFVASPQRGGMEIIFRIQVGHVSLKQRTLETTPRSTEIRQFPLHLPSFRVKSCFLPLCSQRQPNHARLHVVLQALLCYYNKKKSLSRHKYSMDSCAASTPESSKTY